MGSKYEGAPEVRAHDAAKELLQESLILMPSPVILQESVRVYMTEIIRMNLKSLDRGDIPRALLEREYGKKRRLR